MLNAVGRFTFGMVSHGICFYPELAVSVRVMRGITDVVFARNV